MAKVLTRKEIVEAINKIEGHEGMMGHDYHKRTARILRLHYGLEGDKEHTVQEIGTMYNCTGERIKQIEAKGRRMLRYRLRLDKELPGKTLIREALQRISA